MTTTTSPADHVAWCKTRAMEYVDAGDFARAFASLTSDLRKHPATVDHAAIELGGMLMLAGHLSTLEQMREWIEGVQ